MSSDNLTGTASPANVLANNMANFSIYLAHSTLPSIMLLTTILKQAWANFDFVW